MASNHSAVIQAVAADSIFSHRVAVLDCSEPRAGFEAILQARRLAILWCAYFDRNRIRSSHWNTKLGPSGRIGSKVDSISVEGGDVAPFHRPVILL